MVPVLYELPVESFGAREQSLLASGQLIRKIEKYKTRLGSVFHQPEVAHALEEKSLNLLYDVGESSSTILSFEVLISFIYVIYHGFTK